MHTLDEYVYVLERATGAHTLTSGVLRVFARELHGCSLPTPLGESVAKITNETNQPGTCAGHICM